jgi:hypothetical protein
MLRAQSVEHDLADTMIAAHLLSIAERHIDFQHMCNPLTHRKV